MDENGNPVTLTLTCPVTGSAPLTIQWSVSLVTVKPNMKQIVKMLRHAAHVCRNKVDGNFCLYRYRSGVLDEEFKMGDGSYVFPNINETHVDYANGEGVEYYCTAENCLGTIRSPTVKAFYAGMHDVRIWSHLQHHIFCLCSIYWIRIRRPRNTTY